MAESAASVTGQYVLSCEERNLDAEAHMTQKLKSTSLDLSKYKVTTGTRAEDREES